MGAFCTGVIVITTRGVEHSYGMTASAFSSVSLDPPLVLTCIAHTAEGSEAIAAAGVFAVNVLGAHQEAVARHFASKSRPRGKDAFRDVPHRRLVTGSPILDGAAAYFDCDVHETHDVGDHRIFIGEVLALGVDDGVPPLLFHSGGYARLRE